MSIYRVSLLRSYLQMIFFYLPLFGKKHLGARYAKYYKKNWRTRNVYFPRSRHIDNSACFRLSVKKQTSVVLDIFSLHLKYTLETIRCVEKIQTTKFVFVFTGNSKKFELLWFYHFVVFLSLPTIIPKSNLAHLHFEPTRMLHLKQYLR